MDGDATRVEWKAIFLERHRRDQEINQITRKITVARSTLERITLEKEMLSYGNEGLERLRKVQVEGSKHSNLQVKYWAKKVVDQFFQEDMLNNWRRHISLPVQEQKLEDGAVIIAQSFGFPRLPHSFVHQQLDDIANVVKNRAATWGDSQHHRFCELNKYFFGELGFRGFEPNDFLPSKSFIHQILKSRRGIQIGLCLVYAVVARRLNLPVRMIGVPKHFLTRYDGEGQYNGIYVDVFGGGRMFSREDLEKFSLGGHNAVASPQEVYSRLLRNLIEEYNGTGEMEKMLYALNQSVLIIPQQEELAYRVVLHANYTGKIDQAISDLNALRELGSITLSGENLLKEKIGKGQQRLLSEHEEAKRQILAKRRTSRVPHTFYIGQMVRHSTLGYRALIYSWDLTPDVECLGNNDPLRTTDQLFYHVLIDSKDEPPRDSYVAEQDIVLDQCGDPITHPEVGRYFAAYCNGRYTPGPLLTAQYPDDCVYG